MGKVDLSKTYQLYTLGHIILSCNIHQLLQISPLEAKKLF